MKEVYIALGSNIEPRETFMKQAQDLLEKHEEIKVLLCSSIYETAPVGYMDQADFLNMVVRIETSLLPVDLLNYCQHIESFLNRKREIKFGPRTIDLDILVYNQENIKTDRLTVPHPRMHKRAFVLVPLHEIAKDLILPVWKKTPVYFLEQLPENDKKDVMLWTGNGLANE